MSEGRRRVRLGFIVALSWWSVCSLGCSVKLLKSYEFPAVAEASFSTIEVEEFSKRPGRKMRADTFAFKPDPAVAFRRNLAEAIENAGLAEQVIIDSGDGRVGEYVLSGELLTFSQDLKDTAFQILGVGMALVPALAVPVVVWGSTKSFPLESSIAAHVQLEDASSQDVILDKTYEAKERRRIHHWFPWKTQERHIKVQMGTVIEEIISDLQVLSVRRRHLVSQASSADLTRPGSTERSTSKNEGQKFSPRRPSGQVKAADGEAAGR